MDEWWIRLLCRTQYREENSTEPPKNLSTKDLAIWRDEAIKINNEESQSAGAY